MLRNFISPNLIAKLDHHFFTCSLVILSRPHLFCGLLSKLWLFTLRNVQQRAFERQLHFYFLFRFAMIWSITYQRTKEEQIIQFQFLLPLQYQCANQAPDPYPSVRVTQKIKNCQSSNLKWVRILSTRKGLFFHNRFISSGLFLLKKIKLIMTHCISGTWHAVIGSCHLFGIITVSCALHPGA